MTAPFTPGPWRVCEQRSAGPVFVVSRSGNYLADCDFGNEAEANARLIAAAPKMYEILEWIAGMSGDPAVRNMAEAALKQARGE